MSVDTYFCLCCLSTDDLITLYGFNSEENYAKLLQELFLIEPFHDDYVDDSYICSKCVEILKETHKFKKQFMATIQILQVNGLISTENKENHLIIRKATSSFLEDKKKCLLEPFDDLKGVQIDTNQGPKIAENSPVKTENLDTTKDLQNTDSSINIKHSPIKQNNKNIIKNELAENLQCKECQQNLPNTYMYHRHLNEHFPNHICDCCGKGFLTQKKLKRHITCHNEGPFNCDICNTEFKNYNSLVSHRQRKHYPKKSKPAKRKDLNKNYECTTCNKKYTSYGTLYTHLRVTHTAHRRYFCSQCPVGFYHKQDLNAHECMHNDAGLFVCQMCNKRYLRRKALKVHMRTHSDDRRFTCDVCGKRFIQKCTLTSHLKTHNQNIVFDE